MCKLVIDIYFLFGCIDEGGYKEVWSYMNSQEVV